MAEVQWPAALQQKLNSDSFSETLANTLLRSDVDIGVAKVRRRYTKGVKHWVVSIDITAAQYTDLTTFYNTTVNGGATRFEFTHPISTDIELARFLAPPAIKPKGRGGVHFVVTMNWEILPSV